MIEAQSLKEELMFWIVTGVVYIQSIQCAEGFNGKQFRSFSPC